MLPLLPVKLFVVLLSCQLRYHYSTLALLQLAALDVLMLVLMLLLLLVLLPAVHHYKHCI